MKRILLPLLFLAATASAQRPLTGDTFYTWPMTEGPAMPFYFGLKGTPAEGERLPLFVHLHGSGPREQEWAASLSWAKVFDDAPSLYFIPEIPTEARYRWYQQEKQQAFEQLLRQALALPYVDPARIYIQGISEGGYGSQRLASFYADYLAGAGPMAGGEPLRNAPVENLQHIAFTLRTGELDNGFYRRQLTLYTKEALDSTAQKNHWVQLEAGRGHGIDYRPTPAWLKQFRREARPTQFAWEQFAMDGRYRTSWYNITSSDTLSADNDERRRYDYTLTGNTIEIKASTVVYTPTEVDPQWGIELRSARSYTPVEPRHLTVFLSEDMIDPSRPVTLLVNGRRMAQKCLTPSHAVEEESRALWGDPLRVFTMKIGY